MSKIKPVFWMIYLVAILLAAVYLTYLTLKPLPDPFIGDSFYYFGRVRKCLLAFSLAGLVLLYYKKYPLLSQIFWKIYNTFLIWIFYYDLLWPLFEETIMGSRFSLGVTIGSFLIVLIFMGTCNLGTFRYPFLKKIWSKQVIKKETVG